jgi:transposase-like protein
MRFSVWTGVSKLLYLALRNIAKKWTMPLHFWKDALNRFAIVYESAAAQLNPEVARK